MGNVGLFPCWLFVCLFCPGHRPQHRKEQKNRNCLLLFVASEFLFGEMQNQGISLSIGRTRREGTVCSSMLARETSSASTGAPQAGHELAGHELAGPMKHTNTELLMTLS